MYFLEDHCVHAGWVDPGYKGHVTGQPLRRKFPAIIQKGEALALGRIFKYTSPVKRPYGSKELNSHYQNSTGVGSRS